MNSLINELYKDNKNLIITGNISTGKTTNILFPLVSKVIDNEENLCILDSKEEYIYKYYDTLIDNGYNIIVINLREPIKSDGFNPLIYPYNLYKEGREDKCIDVLKDIGTSLFYEVNSDPFWSSSATDYFIGLVMSLFEDASLDEINLNSIYTLLNSRNRKIEKYIKLKDRNSKAYMSISPVILAPIEIKGTIITLAREKIRDLIIKDNLSKMLSKTTFDYKDLDNRKNAIFIIGKDETLSLSRITSVIVNEIYQVLMDFKGKNKYYFILDNIDTVDNITNFKEMLSSGISRSIKFLIGTRSYIDLEEKYSDYIKKLSDILEINDKEIDLYRDNKIDTIEYEYKDININRNISIKYPSLDVDNIKIFSLGSYLKDKLNIEPKNDNVVDKEVDSNKEILYDKEDEINKYNELVNRINFEIEKVEINHINEIKDDTNKEKDDTNKEDVVDYKEDVVDYKEDILKEENNDIDKIDDNKEDITNEIKEINITNIEPLEEYTPKEEVVEEISNLEDTSNNDEKTNVITSDFEKYKIREWE